MKIDFFENELLIFICLCLSVMRIYLEVIKFDFAKLPFSAKLTKIHREKIHRTGLYLSVGQIILFAPQFLIS